MEKGKLGRFFRNEEKDPVLFSILLVFMFLGVFILLGIYGVVAYALLLLGKFLLIGEMYKLKSDKTTKVDKKVVPTVNKVFGVISIILGLVVLLSWFMTFIAG